MLNNLQIIKNTFLFIFCTLTMPTFGQTINKCSGLNGEIVYQKEPCLNSNQTTIKIDKTPDNLSDYEKKWQSLEKKWAEEREKSAKEAEKWKPVTERNTTEDEANLCLNQLKKITLLKTRAA